jgi:hypothetical protein
LKSSQGGLGQGELEGEHFKDWHDCENRIYDTLKGSPVGWRSCKATWRLGCRHGKRGSEEGKQGRSTTPYPMVVEFHFLGNG